MGHIVRIQSREQHIAALRVLNEVHGMWTCVGKPEAPVFLLNQEQYDALVQAGVVQSNGKEVKGRGKKAPAKKAKP